jgi:hypothetical protein
MKASKIRTMPFERSNVRHRTRTTNGILFFLFAFPCLAAAQTGERPIRLGAIVASVASSEFDSTDAGLGVQATWHPTPLIGAEVEVVIHPADLGDPAFSSGRIETLFGVSVGPRIGRWRPFAKVRSGILRYGQSPEPIACITVFPAPVECTLASGRTVAAFDFGGGVERFVGDRTFVRFDAGDRMLTFPGPVRDSAGAAHEDGYFAHDLRIAVSAGIRF